MSGDGVLGLHQRDDGTDCPYAALGGVVCTKCGWTPLVQELNDLRAENERLLDLLQDIDGIVRDASYRVPGDPESPSKGAQILARIRAVLGHAAGERERMERLWAKATDELINRLTGAIVTHRAKIMALGHRSDERTREPVWGGQYDRDLWRVLGSGYPTEPVLLHPTGEAESGEQSDDQRTPQAGEGR